MQAHITTSLVGERAGEIFRDIYIRDADGDNLPLYLLTGYVLTITDCRAVLS